MAIKVTKALLDATTGMIYNADIGCLEDEDRVNWWLEAVNREWTLVNRFTRPLSRELAEELIAATTLEKSGGFVTRDGATAHIDGSDGPKLKR